MCEVHRRLPRQRTSVDRVGVQRHLDALVLDIARILVTVGIRLARKGRKLEELVVRIGLVVGQVDAQPVVEEPPFQPRFEGVGHLRFEVGAGGGVGGIDAPAGRNVRFGVGDEHGDVVPHAAPCQANLGERNPPGQFEHLADHPRCACRIIEEPAAFVGGVGERRCPVVASRNLEIEAPGIFERRRGEKRLRLAPRIDLFIDIGRTVHDDIGDVEHVGEIERRRLGIYTQ